MTDPRALNVQRFREEQKAERLWVLSAIAPFTVSQDRFVLIETEQGARLEICAACTPRTPLGQGQKRLIAPETLAAFLRAVEAADAAWDADAIPAAIHDGVTITVECASAGSYRRVRMVAPPAGTPHAALLDAWRASFEEVRKALR
ncbi:MAG: hypothetical protein HY866_04810 [Chloroflexi bacterium]|nr:hypothetical protein [Chloroflexota bacterium]